MPASDRPRVPPRPLEPRSRRARGALVPLLCAAACGPVGAGGGGGGLPSAHAYWRADDRVLITDFRELGAVAADRSYVFAAGEHGVIVYDQRFRRWLAPLTIEDGFPRADPAIALEVDPFTGILWMVTRSGGLWAHDVAMGGDWRRTGFLPGAPPVRLIAHEGSLWAHTSAGWFESAGGGAPPARTGAPPAEVQAAAATGLERLEAESPGFRSTASSLTVDEYLRRWQITGAAPGPDPGRWWLATWGGGLYAYDDRMLDAQRHPFGTLGRGVSAIAVGDGAAGGVAGPWFGGDGLGRHRGVAHADHQLQSWSWYEAGLAGAPGGPVHAIQETEAGVFVGARDGLYRLSGGRWDRLTDFEELPSTEVHALALGGGALWVGTAHGLARVAAAPGGTLTALAIDGTIGTRVNALAVAGSVLWLATDRGLWSLDTSTGALSQPPIQDPRLRGRIVGVAYDAGVLHVLAESTLLAYDGAAWSTPLVGASLAAIGRPTHLAARDGIVWIAGATGVLALDPLAGAETLLSVPRDIPEGPVRQVTPVAGGVWLATPAGALLIRIR